MIFGLESEEIKLLDSLERLDKRMVEEYMDDWNNDLMFLRVEDKLTDFDERRYEHKIRTCERILKGRNN